MDPSRIIRTYPSKNFDKRINKITKTEVDKPTILVLHYTVSDLERSLQHFTKGTVSPHYTVDCDGRIYAHVGEEFRAWHAGAGRWGLEAPLDDVNSYSIGIETVNAGYRSNPSQPPGISIKGSSLEWYPFDKPQQVKAIIDLASDIVQRYGIEPRNVIGHADLAPTRKEDPGPLFPWATLAAHGVGAWVDKESVDKHLTRADVDVAEVQKKLYRYGYTMTPMDGQVSHAMRHVVSAFQMHFRPSNISGQIDKETVATLDALLEKYCPRHHDQVDQASVSLENGDELFFH